MGVCCKKYDQARLDSVESRAVETKIKTQTKLSLN